MVYDPLAVRFWSKVDFLNPNGCWTWARALHKADGYGAFRAGNKAMKAHRFAYETLVGPVPVGLVLDHTCHTRDQHCPGGACVHRRCINPAHLEPVQVGENTNRGKAADVNRARLLAKTHCDRGHEFTPENTRRTPAGTRRCRTCVRLASRRYRQQKAVAA